MYESKISNAQWIAYDLPGNLGWIMFLVGLVLCFIKKSEITGGEDTYYARMWADYNQAITWKLDRKEEVKPC